MSTRRFLFDKIAARVITIGGLSIIGFILLVFFYLFRQVVPLFSSASVETLWHQSLSVNDNLLFVDINEHNDVIIKIHKDGKVSFYDLRRSITLQESRLPIRNIAAFSADAPVNQLVFLTDDSGSVLPIGYEFTDDFTSDSRITKGSLTYPLGESLIEVSQAPIKLISSLSDERSTTIIAFDEAGRLSGRRIFKQENLITGVISRDEEIIQMPSIDFAPDFIQLFDRQDHFVIATKDGKSLLININRDSSLATITQQLTLSENSELQDIEIMLGSESLVSADSHGDIRQWFLVRHLPQLDTRDTSAKRGSTGTSAAGTSAIERAPENNLENGRENSRENGRENNLRQQLLLQNIRNFKLPLPPSVSKASQASQASPSSNLSSSSEQAQSAQQSSQPYDPPATSTRIIAVRNSKSFLVLMENGRLIFINAPSGKQSINYKIANSAADVAALAISSRSDGIIVAEYNGEHTVLAVDNPHPDISISRLFKDLWYEGYEKPKYIWQSTSGDNDFEPKYSLVPLTFGTLKAAMYAMIFSAPLAIAGAIYTAFFMGPRLRRKIKPIIEMMEAFPTVILGFIAGIIMAPYFEKHLPGIITILLLMPVAVVLFGLCFRLLRTKFVRLTGTSEVVIIVPIIIAITFLLLEISPAMELFLFDGDVRSWLNNRGIDYNQRNAMVVGAAMGLAVIPTIYSIAEDAIFSVPKLMVNGAYALGATPMQNVMGIVLPAALSGILSALMIGFGRAVGETMIVLMATGNTPVMSASIFTGMRTLAANIAVELPEAAGGSSHFRVLFLCGLLLLVFTFFINTIAEIIRHKIRKRYANI